MRETIDMLVSILKFIDIEYMTDEEADSICDLRINNEEDRKELIKKFIVPGTKQQFSKDSLVTTKKVIEMAVKNEKETKKVFDRMSFVDQDEVEDKNGFLAIVYKELFNEELIY